MQAVRLSSLAVLSSRVACQGNIAPLIGLVLPSPENHSSMLGRSYVTPLAETTGSLMMSFEIGQPEPFNHYGDAPQTPSWQHASYYLRTMHSHQLVRNRNSASSVAAASDATRSVEVEAEEAGLQRVANSPKHSCNQPHTDSRTQLTMANGSSALLQRVNQCSFSQPTSPSIFSLE